MLKLTYLTDLGAFLIYKFIEHLLNSALYCRHLFLFYVLSKFLQAESNCSVLPTMLSVWHAQTQWSRLKEVNWRAPYLGDIRVIFEPIGHAPVAPHVQSIACGFGSIWAYCTGTQIIQVIMNIKHRKFVELSRIG